MLRTGALTLIVGYQRHVSPRKGWRCAYGVRTGRASCSEFGRRAIEAHGIVAGVRLIFRRFDACRAAAGAEAEERDGEPEGRRRARPRTSCCFEREDLGPVLCTAADAASFACW